MNDRLEQVYISMFCREGYKTFERDTNEMICEPLKGLFNQVPLLAIICFLSDQFEYDIQLD